MFRLTSSAGIKNRIRDHRKHAEKQSAKQSEKVSPVHYTCELVKKNIYIQDAYKYWATRRSITPRIQWFPLMCVGKNTKSF